MNHIQKLQEDKAELRSVIDDAEEQVSFIVAYLHSAKFHSTASIDADWVCVSNDILPKVRAVLSILRTVQS